MNRKQIYLVLDNIRSAHNVGSIFRTADAAGVSKIYLCGYSPTPDNPKVLKTSLGAEKVIKWEYHKQIGRLLKKLKMENGKLKILALERTPNSKNIFDYKLKTENSKLALVVGNEVKGIRKNVLKYAEDILEIPMYGKKESLNVSVATGIAAYQIKNSR